MGSIKYDAFFRSLTCKRSSNKIIKIKIPWILFSIIYITSSETYSTTMKTILDGKKVKWMLKQKKQFVGGLWWDYYIFSLYITHKIGIILQGALRPYCSSPFLFRKVSASYLTVNLCLFSTKRLRSRLSSLVKAHLPTILEKIFVDFFTFKHNFSSPQGKQN